MLQIKAEGTMGGGKKDFIFFPPNVLMSLSEACLKFSGNRLIVPVGEE